MKVLKIEPNKKPEVKDILEGLESLQQEVEGYIEVVYPFEDPVGLVVNEEGKINGMELNRALRDEDGNLYDIIAGPFLVVGLTEDDFCSLSDEMLEKYSKLYEKPEIFMNLGGKIHVIPMDETIAQDIRM